MVLNEWRGSAGDAEYSTIVIYFSYISLKSRQLADGEQRHQ